MQSAEILLTTQLTTWFELDFGEAVTVLPSSMTFVDADNDGISEFVAGSVQGDLFIFKSHSARYWKKASDLGMITTVGAGDIMQKKKNVVYVVTGEGSIYTFMLAPGHISLEEDGTKARDSRAIKPYSHQKIPPNIVMSVLADIDGDGYPEILFGMTDRVVRSFKWVENTNTKEDVKGWFVTLNKWEFAGQIGNLSSSLSDGVAEIFVSQPGGSCCRLKACVSLNTNSILETNFEPPVYHNPTASRSRNPLMQTQVLAGVSFKETSGRAVRSRQNSSDKSKNIYAVCSFDGSLSVCNEDTVLWEHQTSEHLIGVYPFPLRDEFILVAGSGAVYIVNDEKKMLKLLTTESINGFTAGLFGTVSQQGDHVNSCAFATICSGGRIFIYHSMNIPNLSMMKSVWRRPKKQPLPVPNTSI
ncbi:putative Integrin-alpha FG-GAP repeat-containing protein 2 [Hypsibius exemplaris]|uniref:Integrin-alpha FG-GAP repeat-containing protein 2 n=1 Tax=Hypsibius exemplaris TaxID=2072580 RepID=A0A1W0X1U3_HYPEX|nr:putative Integrin-alpha FG-GAP repeat-containing protein 2 [Hypsibius exemplaris]